MASFNQLIKDLEQIPQRLPVELIKAENNTLAAMDTEAKKLSSGAVSTEQLSTKVKDGGYGAPYGHGPRGWLGPRGPIPYGDPAVINKQTGSFYSAWRKLGASLSGSVISTALINFDRAAEFLSHRTLFSIRRPIDDRVIEKTKGIRVRNIGAALDKVFKFK